MTCKTNKNLNDTKKILHVINVSFVINHFFGNQFDYFNKKGYTFFVACTPDEKLDVEAQKKNFIPVPVQVVRSINPWIDLKSIIQLYRFIKKENIKVVVAHSPKGGLIGMAAAFFARVPQRVFFRHGLVFETATGWKRFVLMYIEKMTAFWATKVINVSESIESESNKWKLNHPKKNLLLGRGTCNGIDIQKFKPRTKTTPYFVVGYVGRLNNDKGIKELVAAWQILKETNTNMELHLVGPMDDRDALDTHTRRLISSDSTIRHFGLVENTAPFYNEMDVFILPSYREGFGMVILEASASEIPVITTRKTGCINAIVENETGIFTEITPQAIAKAIMWYKDNPTLRKQYGKNGRKFVEDYFTEIKLFDEIEKKVLN